MICSLFRPTRKKDGRSVRSRLWWGQYRLDGDAAITRVSLGTPDKQVAKERLNNLVKRIQQEREGLIAPGPMREAGGKSLATLAELYTADLDSLGRDGHYLSDALGRIRKLAKECGWKQLRDVTPASFQAWRSKQSLSARTLNHHLATMRSFFGWLIRQKMATFDPLQDVERVDERGRRVRLRRAFTADEVRKLLGAAPVERRRFYLAAYYTGLRRSELEKLQWGDVHLDDEKPFIVARAATTKNRQDAKLWLRPELLATLRAMRPADAAADQLVFGCVVDIQGGHKLRRFRRDLEAAGIAFKDAQGRTADLHALARMTPNTHMGQLGVGERVRQEFMRHSDLRLTSAVYTDVAQLPTVGAIQALPSFSAGDDQKCTHKDAQRDAQKSAAAIPDESCPCTIDYMI